VTLAAGECSEEKLNLLHHKTTIHFVVRQTQRTICIWLSANAKTVGLDF
jgi:hypothetical protein